MGDPLETHLEPFEMTFEGRLSPARK